MRQSGSYGLKHNSFAHHCPVIWEKNEVLSLNNKVESQQCRVRVPHLILAPSVIAVPYTFGLCYICCIAYADVELNAFLAVLDSVCTETHVARDSPVVLESPVSDTGHCQRMPCVFQVLERNSLESMQVRRLR